MAYHSFVLPLFSEFEQVYAMDLLNHPLELYCLHREPLLGSKAAQQMSVWMWKTCVWWGRSFGLPFLYEEPIVGIQGSRLVFWYPTSGDSSTCIAIQDL